MPLQDIDQVSIGENVQVKITVSNPTDQYRTVEYILSIRSVYYNGVQGQLVSETRGELPIEPKESKSLLKIIILCHEIMSTERLVLPYPKKRELTRVIIVKITP